MALYNSDNIFEITYPILSKLSDQRIFDLYDKPTDLSVSLTEGCDGYFSCKLTCEEIKQLAAELLAFIANNNSI